MFVIELIKLKCFQGLEGVGKLKNPDAIKEFLDASQEFVDVFGVLEDVGCCLLYTSDAADD